jgi:hypothetical protein
MSRSAIITLLTIGIAGQLFRIWIARPPASELTTLQRVAFWTKQLALPSILLCAVLSFLGTQTQAPLDMILVASLVAWAVSSLWLRRLSMTIRLKGTSESIWSPFQSPEVREICAHLTRTEHALLMEDARGRGRQIGQWFAVPLAVVVGFLYWSWRLGLVLVALFVVYFVLWVIPRFRAMRRHSIEFLCETEWARSRNYAPARLRLMTLPWSK